MSKKEKILWGLFFTGILIFTLRVMFLTRIGKPHEFPLQIAVKEILAPLQKGITTIIKQTDNVLVYFQDNRILRQQNEELTEKVGSLEEELFSLKDQELENQRLLKLLNYQEEKSGNYDLEMAKVIGRNPANWYEMITLDKGKKQGIRPGMVVVNHDGLIGRVIQVTINTADVLLILDREGAVGGRIFENRHTPGVVVGVDNSQYLQMIHLPHDVPIEVNQTVVTSGLGGVYPGGIRIGQVIEVTLEPQGLMKQAKIKPFVDFSRLEEVFIIKQVKMLEETIMPADEISSEVGGGS